MKQCNVCKETKELTEFNKASTYKDKVYHRGECKPCNLKMQSLNQSAQIKYRRSEKGKEVRKQYKKTEKCLEYNREYDRERGLKPERKQKQYENLKRKLNEDPFFRLKHNLRNRVRGAFKAKVWYKNNSVIEFIGCELDFLKDYIASKFEPGMTWDNYGKYGWHVDHIYPLSLAKTAAELEKLCHYTNLQPLWAKDNLYKGNKI